MENIKIKIIQHVSAALATVKLLEFSSHIQESQDTPRNNGNMLEIIIQLLESKAPLATQPTLFVSGFAFYLKVNCS